MAAALFAFLAAAFAGIGARDQMLVAALTARGGRRWAVLLVVLCTAWLSTYAAVWAAGLIAGELNDRAGLLLAALALALAALELAILAPRPAPEEPTRSLGAATIVGVVSVFVTERIIFKEYPYYNVLIRYGMPSAPEIRIWKLKGLYTI